MTRARRWRWIAEMVLACVAAFATIVSARSMQPPATTGGVIPAGPGPLERVAVQPSLDVPAPRRTAHVAPDWPVGVAGRVRYRVHLVVDASGAVAEVRVVSGAPPAADTSGPAADEVAAVLAAVRQWKFEPPAQAPMLLATYVGTGDTEGIVASSPTERRPIRIGGGMRPPTKIHHVSPEYPADARNAGLSGVVILEATIDPEGVVSHVQIVRSVTGLDEAAMSAVRQWRYTPTWLNGEPVPVIMTVTVNFQPQ
jgi:TonB family protein